MKHLSEKSLTNVALFYLRKHSASRKGLVQMLERKVKLALRAKGGDPVAVKAIVDGVVAHMEKNGYVDDARFAESKTASLHRQGKSSRVIQMKLREKGIEPSLAAKSAISTPEQEFEAACMLVKRKRLGRDPERKQKDFAVLMRAGFGSDLARRALAASAEEEVVEAGRVVQLTPRSGQVPRSGETGQVIAFPGSFVPDVVVAKKAAPVRGLEDARALVKKKRLGVDPARRQKDLAVLMRAGFRFDVGKQALDNPVPLGERESGGLGELGDFDESDG
ncbi:MAG: regulatory protein RecX [Archangium sp.]|nr:regulatory protein RecX [Archangium sp.]MDP3155127.1 regulatory protein RecX [Archangium sp.]MDP3573362.1 regulatory protein RecX [Archangium sp.]